MNGHSEKKPHILIVRQDDGKSFQGHVENADGLKVHEVEGDSGVLNDLNYLPDLTSRLVSSGHIPEGSTIDRIA